MSLINHPQIQKISLFSIRLIQTQRVFDFIQQNVQNPGSVITFQILKNFILRFYPLESENVNQILKKLDKQNIELNQDNFKLLLAQNVQQKQLTYASSLIQYYECIKDFFHLRSNIIKEKINIWDINQNLTSNMKENKLKSIDQVFNSLYLYSDSMSYFILQSSFQRIIYCLTILTVSQNQNHILTVYKTFLKSTILGYLNQFMVNILNEINKIGQVNGYTPDINVCINFLQLLSYFYGASKYNAIKQILNNSNLFNTQTYQILIQCLKIPDNRVRKYVIICFTFLSKYSNNLNNYILSDSNRLNIFIFDIVALADQSTIYSLLILLKNINRQINKKQQNHQKTTQIIKIQQKIYTYAFYLLGNSQHFLNQKQSMKIISQIIYIFHPQSNQIAQLTVLNNVYKLDNTGQLILIPGALKILQTSILYKMKDLKDNLIKNHQFLLSLKKNLSDPNSPLFYQYVHIVYLLSIQNSAFLIQKQIFNIILKLMDGGNSAMISIVSDIILNFVKEGLQNQKLLEILYDQFLLFDRIIPYLLKKCFERDDFLHLLICRLIKEKNQNNYSYNYFNKYVFFNIFKILYCLSEGISRKHKKFAFSKKLNHQVVNSISMIIRDLFNCQNQPLVGVILRQKIKIQNCKKIAHENGLPFYKVINSILQEMTYNVQDRPIQFLQLISFTKKQFSNSLLKYFKVNDLEVQKIPIYINYVFKYVTSDFNKSFKRDIPHKFDYNLIKNYLKITIAQINGIKETEVKDFALRTQQNHNSRIIRTQYDFHKFISKILEYKQTNAVLNIVQVELKQKKEDVTLSRSYMHEFAPNREGGHMSKSQIFNNRHNNFIERNRVGGNPYHTINPRNSPQLRGRSYHSPNNLTYNHRREVSPNFGLTRNIPNNYQPYIQNQK